MSRLVKAEDVKELLLGLDSLPWEEQVDELVDAMPTAYDVEAVVRELESKIKIFEEQRIHCEKNSLYTSAVSYNSTIYGLLTAIEIVKRGGRNDAL